MKKYFRMGLFLISYLVSTALEAASILAYSDVYQDYVKFLKGRSPYDITNFKGENTRRDVVEIILIQQALKIGGYTGPIKIIHQEVRYRRVLSLVAQGLADTVSNSVWLTDVDKKKGQFYISDILIPEDKFVAGFYVLADKVDRVNIEVREDIGKYIAICNINWPVDLAVLKSLNAKCVYSPSWGSMVKMLKAKRGDFILTSFQSTQDLALQAYGVKLLPVRNIKVSLQERRVFVVSKLSKEGGPIFHALQKGIKELMAKGMFDKAYRESGFYNEAVKDWKMIKPKLSNEH